MRRIFAFYALTLLCCTLVSCKSYENSKEHAEFTYQNPIDDYYCPRINAASSEVELRQLQVDYHGQWKDEFASIINWMTSKCEYSIDRERIDNYAISVYQQTDLVAEVLLVDWMNFYNIEEDLRYIQGNGTIAALLQAKGEIYRDSAMRLISYSYTTQDEYEFREIDYENSHYE